MSVNCGQSRLLNLLMSEIQLVRSELRRQFRSDLLWSSSRQTAHDLLVWQSVFDGKAMREVDTPCEGQVKLDGVHA